jgi:hypothetical protein
MLDHKGLGECDMQVMKENKFGYLTLTDSGDQTSLFIKANKITLMMYAVNGKIVIFGNNKTGVVVDETIDEILEQLENIHPSMR